jgi:hypothetical protein
LIQSIENNAGEKFKASSAWGWVFYARRSSWPSIENYYPIISDFGINRRKRFMSEVLLWSRILMLRLVIVRVSICLNSFSCRWSSQFLKSATVIDSFLKLLTFRFFAIFNDSFGN